MECKGAPKLTRSDLGSRLKCADAPPKSTKRRSGAKSSFGKLISTFSDIFSTSSDDRIHALRAGSDEATLGSEPIKLADALAALNNERLHVQRIQEQLDVAVAVNTEMKVSSALHAEEMVQDQRQQNERLKEKLRHERKGRVDSEARMQAALQELGLVRAALEACRKAKEQLELELLEAASDVLDQQHVTSAYQAVLRRLREAQTAGGRYQKECRVLRSNLAKSEETRRCVERELNTMQAEAQHWELALDALQDQLDQALIQRSKNAVNENGATRVALKDQKFMIEVDATTDGIAEWHE